MDTPDKTMNLTKKGSTITRMNKQLMLVLTCVMSEHGHPGHKYQQFCQSYEQQLPVRNLKNRVPSGLL